MPTSPKITFGAVALAGAISACSSSSVDDAVDPEITAATITVDRTRPSGLATVNATLVLTAGSDADRVVELTEVMLQKPGPVTGATLVTLALSFPASFNGRVHDGERREIVLENLGTTNQALEVLCGQTVQLVTKLGYDDEPGTWSLSAPVQLVVSCP